MKNEPAAVDIEMDTSFNNRLQSGFEAATQSFAPIIDSSRDGYHVLDVQIANKLCGKRDCSHETCKKNYPAHSSIASSEPKFLKNAIETLETNNIQIRSITTDGSAQLKKVIREHRRPITHYVCFVHRMRTVQKRINQVKFTGNLGGNRNEYIMKLSTAVRSRVKMELTRIGKKVDGKENLFVTQARKAVENIIPCFSGRHRKCREVSLVCCHHLAHYHTGFLPLNQHLKLSRENEMNLQETMNNMLCEDELRRLSTLRTTNRCESLHSKVFTYAPKNTCWSRNFIGLGHSAVHSATQGYGKSMIIMAKRIGLKYTKQSQMTAFLTKIDSRTKYDRHYKSSLKYNLRRYYTRKQKANRRQLERETAK